MTEGWKSVRLNQFEHVVTGPSQSLLRVNGKAPRRSSPGPRPVLVIGTSPAAHRFAPLRAPEDRSRFLHVAYAVPTALAQSGAPCWLEFEDGFRIELPVPEEGTARMRDGRIAAGPSETETAPLPDDEALSPAETRSETEARAETGPAPEAPAPSTEPTQADDESAALRQRIDKLEQARDDDRRAATASAAQLQTRLEASEQRVETAERELQSAHARAQASLHQAETAERELESAHSRAKVAEEQLQAIEARAQSAEAQEQAALARVTELEQKDQMRKARIEELERDLAEAAPAREALEREVSKLRASLSSIKRELEQARDQLRVMTFERDELSRQAAAFDAVAVKARDRASRAEAANEKATATLSELQTWRGELERRLAETTSELGAARAARETDERELQRLRATLAERDRRGSEAQGRTNGGEHSETVAAQAEEIEHLASELAALRARVAREP